MNQRNPGELDSLKDEASLNKERFYLKIKLTVACVTRIYPHCWAQAPRNQWGKLELITSATLSCPTLAQVVTKGFQEVRTGTSLQFTHEDNVGQV